MRTVPVVVTLVVLLLAGLPGAAAAAPSTRPTTAAAGCPGLDAPGPAVDESEAPEPGEPVPPPLPVPDEPVGGPAMGSCGTVVPDGAPPPPEVGVVSYVVADLDSGEVLAARAPHARLRPASLLKTITGLLVARDLPLDDVVVGTREDADQEGTRVGMGPGGVYTVRQLLTGMMIASGNDTAHALAVRLTGSVPATVERMNETAREVGALDTRAATPSGLDGPGQQSSAYDLASLFRLGMAEPAFAEAVTTREMVFPGFGGAAPFEVENDNRILDGYPGAIGGKTGFTTDARHTYIGAAERDGRRLVAVLMRGEQRPVRIFAQGTALLDYGFALPPDAAIGELTTADREQDGGSGESNEGSGALSGSSGPASGTTDWTVPLTIGGAVLLALLLAAARWRRG